MLLNAKIVRYQARLIFGIILENEGALISVNPTFINEIVEIADHLVSGGYPEHFNRSTWQAVADQCVVEAIEEWICEGPSLSAA